MKTINIAHDFSDIPAGRFPEDGDFNATKFREDFLRPAIETEDKVIVEIDGVFGYGSSFLEEAFGGLVSKWNFSVKALEEKLEIRYKDKAYKMYETLIWQYIKEAKKA